MKKLAVIIAMALLGTSSAVLWLQLRQERARSADLQARLETMEAAPPSQAQRLPQTVPAVIDPASPTGTASTDTPAAEAAEHSTATATVVWGPDQTREMYSTPEGRASVRPTLRGVLATQFPDYAKALNLNVPEADRLLDLLTEQRMDTVRDSQGGARDPAAQQEKQRKLAELKRIQETELQAMLGGKYPQWQEYQESIPSRQQLSQLQGLLNSGGNPLGETQSGRLLTALAAERKRINQEEASAAAPPPRNPRDMLQQQLERTSDSNRRFLETASSHLTSQQLESYQRMLDQELGTTRKMLQTVPIAAN